jgi:hypothetical protein
MGFFALKLVPLGKPLGTEMIHPVRIKNPNLGSLKAGYHE